MEHLFRIETDRVAITWSKGSAKDPSLLSGPSFIPGRLAISKRRDDIRLSVWRSSVPDGVAEDPELTVGPQLYEQIDYKLYARANSGTRVTVAHRDPVTLRDLSEEDGGKVVYGYINFGSQAGRSNFSILIDDQPEFDFEVEVFPAKLDYASDYDQILAEIQEILTGLALEYLRSTYQLGRVSRVPQPTHLEWLALLRHIASDLERALQQIAQHPIRGLTREPIRTRAEKIKRADSAVRSAIRRGAGSGNLTKLSKGTLIREQLTERRARQTLNTSEHRWLASQLEQIRRRIGWLRREEAVRETSRRRERVVREMDELEAKIARLSQLEPLVSVEGDPPSGFASLQLLTAPGYREAYRSCLILSLGLRIEGGPLKLSIKDLSLLYEYWCYLALLRLVSEETNRPIPAKDFFTIKQQGLQVTLQKGRESRVQFDTPSERKIIITYNPLFQGDAILIPQQPDIMISFKDPDWPTLHFLLDAKYRVDASPEYIERYKTPGPPEDALNALHRYRDAILENDESYQQGDRPKRTIVQASAVFPYRELSHGDFSNSLLWQSLDRLGVGAVPALPGSIEYIRQWLRSALQRGGWAIADRAIAHRARESVQSWRAAAAETVLVGVLRNPDSATHLSWIEKERLYYTPLSRTQRRQFTAKWVAIYSPATLRQPGAITHLAAVMSVEVIKRNQIDTPWRPSRKPDEMQVLYRLDELKELEQPIENRNVKGRSQRFSTNRWTSRLALERARVLMELFLETESEWRLYEDLKARGITFHLDPGPAIVADPDDPMGRTWFVIDDGRRIRYSGASGFLVKLPDGTEEYRWNIG
jgi:uncharacterized protein